MKHPYKISSSSSHLIYRTLKYRQIESAVNQLGSWVRLSMSEDACMQIIFSKLCKLFLTTCVFLFSSNFTLQFVILDQNTNMTFFLEMNLYQPDLCLVTSTTLGEALSLYSSWTNETPINSVEMNNNLPYSKQGCKLIISQSTKSSKRTHIE